MSTSRADARAIQLIMALIGELAFTFGVALI